MTYISTEKNRLAYGVCFSSACPPLHTPFQNEAGLLQGVGQVDTVCAAQGGSVVRLGEGVGDAEAPDGLAQVLGVDLRHCAAQPAVNIMVFDGERPPRQAPVPDDFLRWQRLDGRHVDDLRADP